MEAQSRPGGTRDLMLVGLVIAVIGTAALISQLMPEFDRYVPLFIGAVLFAVFLVSRSYPALVGAGIVGGLGIGLVVAQMFPGNGLADGAGATLGLGLGFISVWLISTLLSLKERHWWPLIPGLILSIVGVSLAFDAVSKPLIAPIALLLLGVLIMGVGYFRHRYTHTSAGA
jgi:hypothetical protein